MRRGKGIKDLECTVHRKPWGEAVATMKYAKACCKEEKLFSISSEDKVRNQGVKLQQGRSGLVLRKGFLAVRKVLL